MKSPNVDTVHVDATIVALRSLSVGVTFAIADREALLETVPAT